MTNGTPALPQGFTLDEAEPVLPPGFTIDATKKPMVSQEGPAQEQSGVLSRVSEATRMSPAFKQGTTFGLSDEVAGLAASVGPETLKSLASGDVGQIWETMKNEYSRGQGEDKAQLDAYMEKNPVWGPVQEILGAMVTANIPKATALTVKGVGVGLGKYAKPLLQGMGLGGLYGFGAAEQDEKGRGAVIGAAAGGAVVGGGQALSPLASKTAGKILTKLKKKPKAPQLDALREQANTLYAKAEGAGVVILKNTFKPVVDKIQDKLAEAGFDAGLHPRAMAAYKRLEEATNENMTLKGFDVLRRVVRGAGSSVEPDERRIASIMIDELDEFTDTLGKAGGMLKQARNLWSRMRKGEAAEEIIEKAANSPGDKGKALQSAFRTLANNPKKMRSFTKAEQSAIRKVARGGSAESALRMLGNFAPRSAIGLMLGSAGGYAIGGPVGMGALLMAGEAGRRGATALTRRNANLAADLMKRGGSAPKTQLSGASRQTSRSLLPRSAPGIGQQTPLGPE